VGSSVQLVFEPVLDQEDVAMLNKMIEESASSSVVGGNPYKW
jgi:hypothetical protein